MPTSSIDGDAAARVTAASAMPGGETETELQSSCPVRTNSWVCASTPGVSADQHVRCRQTSGDERFDAVEFIEESR